MKVVTKSPMYLADLEASIEIRSARRARKLEEESSDDVESDDYESDD